MKEYRYLNMDCFKVGEEVWVTGVKFYPSGRLKYCIRPTKREILKKTNNSISVNNICKDSPSIYYLNTPETKNSYNEENSINFNIAKTREEAIENYNYRFLSEIEQRYSDFKNFEERAKSRLL